MATVIQTPETLSLLRNLKSFRINSSSTVSFKLMKGGVTVIEETYDPNGSTMVEIDVQDVCAQYLSIILPSSNVFVQSNGKAEFSAYVDDSLAKTFTVLAGGVRKLSDTASNFLKANWLTWQPQAKRVRWNQPEYLSYYHESASRVRAKFYPVQGNPETVTVNTASAGQYITYNMEMQHLFSLSSHSSDQLTGMVDVWVETTGGTRLSYIQRYIFTPVTRDEHYYLCVNSLGGIDTFCFTGKRSLAPSISHEVAELADTKINITEAPTRSWSQNTGYVGKTEAVWLWEFFASSKQWSIIDGNIELIVLDSSSIQASDKANVNSSDFNFSLAEEGTLLKIVRTNEEFPIIEVPSPSGELFFLIPRVVDYPDANLENSLLFLVQSPFVQEWKKVSLGTIKEWIKEIFTPFSELPLRLEIDTNGDSFLAWGETMHLTCRVWKGMYEDVTEQVTTWRIVRDSGDAVEDAAWNMTSKARLFDGEIDIEFSQSLNDLGASESTTFTITATIDENFQAVGFIEI